MKGPLHYRLLSRCAITVTSFGLLGLGRWSLTVLLPLRRYPPTFGAPWLWPPPPVPVIPCWWCWCPGTKFSLRSRFSTFLVTKADMGRNVGGVGAVLKELLKIDEEGKLLNFANVLSPLLAIFQKSSWLIFKLLIWENVCAIGQNKLNCCAKFSSLVAPADIKIDCKWFAGEF